jgi:hypothetical protein
MPVILGGNTGIYLASLTPLAPSLLLDDYPNAAVAYSLRQLRTAYTGAAIRVRRSSDNAEQDINFVSGDLDTQSLLDFVGYNLLTYSEDISVTASWAGTNINRTGTPPYVDVETAPDSTLTGDKLIENNTSGTHFISRFNTAFAIGSDYNISVYLKPAERTRVYIDSQISGAFQNAIVNLSTGSVVSTTFANTPVITAEANGWYRFSVTINAGATLVVPIRVFLDNGTTTSYTGNGTSGAYVWGSQLSQSSSVLPYGKTVADASRNGFITTWYDQSGNANNAEQPTLLASQAQIVSSGAVITDPNTGKISTTWTADSYILLSNVAVTQNMLVSGVINRTATVTSLWLLGHNGATPRLVGTSNSGDIISQITTAVAAITHGNITTGAFILSGLRDSSNIVKAWTNTTALTTGTSTGVSGNFSRFGFQNTTGSTGRIVEMIFWNNDKESSRSNIVTNQNDYWEVY